MVKQFNKFVWLQTYTGIIATMLFLLFSIGLAEEWTRIVHDGQAIHIDKSTIEHGTETSTALIRVLEGDGRTTYLFHEFDDKGRFRILRTVVVRGGQTLEDSSAQTPWLKPPPNTLGEELIRFVTRHNQESAKARKRPSADSDRSTVSIRTGQILPINSKSVICATDQEALITLFKALVDSDASVAKELVLQGRAFFAEQGEKVKVLKAEKGFVKVIFVTGPNSGKIAWIPLGDFR